MTNAQLIAVDSGGNTSTVMDLNQYLETLAVSKTLIAQADDLALAHENFHTHFVVGGRVALYALLQKIYELVLKLEASSDQSFFVQQMRKNLKNKHGIKTQENSSPTAIVVRYITRADRKTAHVYARAIEAAKATDVPALEFSNYVEEQGGVEKIRATSAQTRTAPQICLSVDNPKPNDDLGVIEYLEAKSEFPLTSFSLKWDQSSISDQDLAVFVCKKRHGRYLVMERLQYKDSSDLEKSLSYRLSNAMKEIEKSPTQYLHKAAIKQDKRRMNLLKKRHPKHFSEVKAALNFGNIGLLGISARRAWIQTK